MAVILSFV